MFFQQKQLPIKISTSLNIYTIISFSSFTIYHFNQVTARDANLHNDLFFLATAITKLEQIFQFR